MESVCFWRITKVFLFSKDVVIFNEEKYLEM